MRPRNEVGVAVLLLGALILVAALLGRQPAADRDERTSTFVAAPGGSRGLLDATIRLGIPVQRFRERSRGLAAVAPSRRPVLVILAPSIPFSAPERSAVLSYGARADLVLAGKSAESLMRCFGYRVNRRFLDSVRIAPPGAGSGSGWPWVRATLVLKDSFTNKKSRTVMIANVSEVEPAPTGSIPPPLADEPAVIRHLREIHADIDRRPPSYAFECPEDSGLFHHAARERRIQRRQR